MGKKKEKESIEVPLDYYARGFVRRGKGKSV
jgi:hypothetical protein